MPRHDNECWDCGQIHADSRPLPSAYHARVQYLRQQAEIATQIRDAAISAWLSYIAFQPPGEWNQEVVQSFRVLFAWVAEDYLVEFELEVKADADYRELLSKNSLNIKSTQAG